LSLQWIAVSAWRLFGFERGDPMDAGTGNVKRKLTAIFSSDVVAYSRLMGEDELETVQTLTSYKQTMSSLIRHYRGREVDSTGDNLLAEFASVVDAVQCAVEVQQVLGTKNEALPENRKMHFRIGINLGDVIEEGEVLYEDGVNIAARVESLAEPGGICISGSAFEQIENKLALGYQYMGEHAVKNIVKPIKVYKVPMEPGAVVPAKRGEAGGRKRFFCCNCNSHNRGNCAGPLAILFSSTSHGKSLGREDGISASG